MKKSEQKDSRFKIQDSRVQCLRVAMLLLAAVLLSSCANTAAVQTQWGQSTTSFFEAMEAKHAAYQGGVQAQLMGGARR